MTRTTANTQTARARSHRTASRRTGLAGMALLAWAGCMSGHVADGEELGETFDERSAAGGGACVAGGQQEDAIQGSGTSVSVALPLANFSGIDAGCVYEVQAVRAEAFEVTIEVDDNLAEFLDVRVDDGALVLDVQPGAFEFTRLRASVSLPQLDDFNVSGAADLSLSGFVSDRPLLAQASAAATVAGDIVAGNTRLVADGMSRVALTGSGSDLELEASGAATVDLRDYPVDDASADVSGASQSVVRVEGRLDAVASGAARLRFLGDPELGVIEESALGSVESF